MVSQLTDTDCVLTFSIIRRLKICVTVTSRIRAPFRELLISVLAPVVCISQQSLAVPFRYQSTLTITHSPTYSFDFSVQGAPIVLSRPHFLDSNVNINNKGEEIVEGLQPDISKHDFHIDIFPVRILCLSRARDSHDLCGWAIIILHVFLSADYRTDCAYVDANANEYSSEKSA